MTSLLERMEQIKKRREASTPGDWERDTSHDPHYNPETPGYVAVIGAAVEVARVYDYRDASNVTFIANAPQDIDWLLNKLAEAIRLLV